EKIQRTTRRIKQQIYLLKGVRVMTTEKRTMTVTEVRTKEDENDMVISGYALKYDTWSQDLSGFVETIDKRTIDKADLSDVRCLIDHDSSRILGRTKSGTLELEKDDIGLRFECTLPNTTYARDLYGNVKVGNISQCSFGFEVDKGGDELRYDQKDSIYKPFIKCFKRISDVTGTSMAAYEDRDVSPVLRRIEHIEKQRSNQIEKEKMLFELEMLDYD